MIFLTIGYGVFVGYFFWKVFENSSVLRDHYTNKIRGAGLVLLPFLLWYIFREWNVPLLLWTVIITLMGLYDDWKGLDGRIKLLITFLISLSVLFVFGKTLPINILGYQFYIPALNEIFWLLFLLGFTNAFNVIDGKDGVLLTTSLTSLIFLFLITQSDFWINIAAICVGLLLYNSPPAKIIMGDTGSYLLGFIISYGFLRNSHLPFEAILLVLFFPFVDTTLTFIRRVVKGKNIFLRDEEHIHHKITDILGDRLGLALIFVLNVLGAVLSYFYLNVGNYLSLLFGYLVWVFVIFMCYRYKR